LLDALKHFAREPGFDAISITTHGASAALLGKDRSLAMPVLDYEHEYPTEIVAAYTALRPSFSETFSPRLPMGLNVGAQLHFQQTAFPDDFANVSEIVTYPQYWAGRLTGVFVNEVTSLGCHTDLWNPKTGSYSFLVDRLGLRDLMAPVRSAFDALGPVLPDIAVEIGLSTDIPVYCGIHDSNASLLAHLVEREAPFAVVSTGTWVVIFGVGGDLDHLDPARDTLANVDAYGRTVPSARFMGGREFEIVTGEIGNVEEDDIEAAIVPVLANGLMLLPNVAAGSGPFPGQTMRWLGAENASPAERHVALSLYLGLMSEVCLGLVGAKGPILVEGPFALNAIYLSVLHALTGRQVIAVPGSTGTSNGAALLTGIRPAEPALAPTSLLALPDLMGYRKQWHAALAAPPPPAL
jgi:sugar (pentulose or hexulose) kinase